MRVYGFFYMDFLIQLFESYQADVPVVSNSALSKLRLADGERYKFCGGMGLPSPLATCAFLSWSLSPRKKPHRVPSNSPWECSSSQLVNGPKYTFIEATFLKRYMLMKISLVAL